VALLSVNIYQIPTDTSLDILRSSREVVTVVGIFRGCFPDDDTDLPIVAVGFLVFIES